MVHPEVPQFSERTDEEHGRQPGFLEVRRQYEQVIMQGWFFFISQRTSQQTVFVSHLQE